MKNLPENTSNVCGIRGATTAKENSKSAIINATTELLEKLTSENDVSLDSIAAVFFTTSCFFKWTMFFFITINLININLSHVSFESLLLIF